MKTKRLRHSSRSRPALILLAAAIVLTAGCMPRATYVCDSGKTLEVTFYERMHKIEVDTGAGTFDLRSVPASTGTRYADEERVFWFKGDELSVTVNDRPLFGQCRKVSETSR
jgi:membrane-bound inhibitor of C-type lysozyme